MRVVFSVIAVLTVMTLSASISEAQTIKKGTISGVVLTRSVDIPNNGSAAVFTTDAAVKGALWLILTQACVSDDEKDVTLIGNTMGQIPLPDQCTTFEPGLAIPRGETLTFSDINVNPQAGMITGILSKK